MLDTSGCLLADIAEYSYLNKEMEGLRDSQRKLENKETEEFKILVEKKKLIAYNKFKKFLDILRCVTDYPVLYLLKL